MITENETTPPASSVSVVVLARVNVASARVVVFAPRFMVWVSPPLTVVVTSAPLALVVTFCPRFVVRVFVSAVVTLVALPFTVELLSEMGSH
jgi:hypothetical protein